MSGALAEVEIVVQPQHHRFEIKVIVDTDVVCVGHRHRAVGGLVVEVVTVFRHDGILLGESMHVPGRRHRQVEVRVELLAPIGGDVGISARLVIV